LAWLNRTAVQPQSLDEIAELMAEAFPKSGVLDTAARKRLLEAYFLIGSAGAHEGSPPLRPKFHSFFHGVYDVGLCLNPGCRELVRNGSEQCPKCDSVVRPAVLCRTCGQDFVKVKFTEEDKTFALPNDDFLSDENTAFITPAICGEDAAEDTGEEEDADEEDEAPRPTGYGTSKPRKNWKSEWVIHRTGHVFKDQPSGGGCSRQWVLRGKGNTCPVCRSTYTRGDILTLLRTGAAATTSVLTTHHLDRLQGDRRKMLAFADNRQDAAHQAGYMNSRHRDFALRHALARLVTEKGPDGIALNTVAPRLLEIFQEMGIAKRRLGTDERKFWLKALEYETAAEFCMGTQQRISLENLAIVEVQYEFLDKLADDPRFNAACQKAGVSKTGGLILLRAMLDQMRRRRAVAFDFFQRFLDPNSAGWSELTGEPYNVVIPEREARPVFFVRKRSEGAKHGPGGTTFFPFFKDSDRGAKAFMPRLVEDRAGLSVHGEEWTGQMISLLEEFEILVPAKPAAKKALDALGREKAWQISPRFVRLVSAGSGWRCRRCHVWRPYRGSSCFGSSRCPGQLPDLLSFSVARDRYYERLYLDAAPRRLRAREHTAQISQEDRARLETKFKEGHIDVIVCSPTLELGVNIGSLDTVLMRNAPPTPANYVQRAGRAGRSQRIGFVSTFCGMGSHDRHCFEEPPWLVRGEFTPPKVKLDNLRILARHIRSLVLEELQQDLPAKLGDLLDDIHGPAHWDASAINSVCDEVSARENELAAKAAIVFGAGPGAAAVIRAFPGKLRDEMDRWFKTIQRLFREWQEWLKILADRHSRQKARARERPTANSPRTTRRLIC